MLAYFTASLPSLILEVL